MYKINLDWKLFFELIPIRTIYFLMSNKAIHTDK